jgi:hypothetical protein
MYSFQPIGSDLPTPLIVGRPLHHGNLICMIPTTLPACPATTGVSQDYACSALKEIHLASNEKTVPREEKQKGAVEKGRKGGADRMPS